MNQLSKQRTLPPTPEKEKEEKEKEKQTPILRNLVKTWRESRKFRLSITNLSTDTSRNITNLPHGEERNGRLQKVAGRY